MDQKQADATAYAPARRRVCSNQRVASFCVKWRNGSRLESMTAYQKFDFVNRYVQCIYLKNSHAKCHPNLIWNDRALGFLKRSSLWRRKTIWVAIWDRFLIQNNSQIYATFVTVNVHLPRSALQRRNNYESKTLSMDKLGKTERLIAGGMEWASFATYTTAGDTRYRGGRRKTSSVSGD